jgi:hypothetical protein
MLEVVDLPADRGDVWLLASKPARGMRALHAAIHIELGVVLSSTGRGRTIQEQWTIFGGDRARYEPCSEAVFKTLTEPADDPPRKRWKKADRDRVRALLSHLAIPNEEFWRKTNLGFATAASPGTSPHGMWCADDLAIGPFPRQDTIGATSAVGQWLFAHEKEFGFGHGLKREAWHLQWFVGDEMPQAVLDFEAIHGTGPGPVETPGTGTRAGRSTQVETEDDMPKAIQSTHSPAIFTANGMTVTWVPDPEILMKLQVAGLAPADEHIIKEDRQFFKNLSLVGEMPPGFTADDFHAVI